MNGEGSEECRAASAAPQGWPYILDRYTAALDGSLIAEMRLSLHNPGMAILGSLLLMRIAFIWAGFVANVSPLRDVRGIPLVVHNPIVALIVAQSTLSMKSKAQVVASERMSIVQKD